MDTPALFHEHDRDGFRARFRYAVSRSTEVHIAVTRLRLGTIDLSPRELEGLRAIHLVLAELRAVELDAEAHALLARAGARGRLAVFGRLLEEGVLKVRVAPLGGWSPDFTVFSDPGGAHAVLVGFHAFEQPHPFPGPALGAHFGPAQARAALSRFREIWARGHDVAPAVRSVFRRHAPAAGSSGVPGAGTGAHATPLTPPRGLGSVDVPQHSGGLPG
ncbi:MAG: hypothetical protein RQ751_12435 [Longimicrobiales bacterium]|nr:hypothetical protein [Longimicrobiales bacterium]